MASYFMFHFITFFLNCFLQTNRSLRDLEILPSYVPLIRRGSQRPLLYRRYLCIHCRYLLGILGLLSVISFYYLSSLWFSYHRHNPDKPSGLVPSGLPLVYTDAPSISVTTPVYVVVPSGSVYPQIVPLWYYLGYNSGYLPINL